MTRAKCDMKGKIDLTKDSSTALGLFVEYACSILSMCITGTWRRTKH